MVFNNYHQLKEWNHISKKNWWGCEDCNSTGFRSQLKASYSKLMVDCHVGMGRLFSLSSRTTPWPHQFQTWLINFRTNFRFPYALSYQTIIAEKNDYKIFGGATSPGAEDRKVKVIFNSCYDDIVQDTPTQYLCRSLLCEEDDTVRTLLEISPETATKEMVMRYIIAGFRLHKAPQMIGDMS